MPRASVAALRNPELSKNAGKNGSSPAVPVLVLANTQMVANPATAKVTVKSIS